MAAIITLKAIVDEMDVLSDEHFAYLNPQTGDLVTLSTEEISAVEEDLPVDDFPEWQQPLITQARAVLDSNEYLHLPTQHDIHEYAIMERFCDAIADLQMRRLFLDQIRGSGAFRRFKQLLHHYALAEEWYTFRTAALKTIAVEWLEENHIPYHQG
jgi:uncharacterized protein UPF0158